MMMMVEKTLTGGSEATIFMPDHSMTENAKITIFSSNRHTNEGEENKY